MVFAVQHFNRNFEMVNDSTCTSIVRMRMRRDNALIPYLRHLPGQTQTIRLLSQFPAEKKYGHPKYKGSR